MLSIVHLCPNYEIFIEKLREHLLGELTPELCHKVACSQRVAVLERWQVLGKSAHAEHIVVHDTNLQQKKCR